MTDSLLAERATAEPSPTKLVAEAWQREAERILANLSGPGLARPEQVAGKTGLQVMTAMLEGAIPYPAMAETLDFQLIEVGPGRAVFQGRPMLKHYNPLGSVHGGWFATLLDSAVGCAVHTSLPAGKSYTTAELKINITRPLTIAVPLVRAFGEVIHLGRRMATAHARMEGPDGRLYAHASTTCFIFDNE
ncbi:PaaI family thioesterase [Piscinibacter sakaiensis]|uniref:PaaI family thioesterase n=1 Tax=Piscinibacter sakaiensis TaxID=1547922 RepID=UPI003AAD2B84